MVSKALQASFLSLVRLGIGKSSQGILNDTDWSAVEELARKQGLLTLLVDAVNQSDKVDALPFATKLAWIGEVVQGYERVFVLYRKAVTELAAFYNARGFKMMVLKGYVCSLNWPRPEHRPCGDIDIYLFGKYKEADGALTRELGIKIDHSHHHHTVFEWQGFTVENHYDFINVFAHKSSRQLEEVFKGLGQDDSHWVEVGGERVYMPSANLHALFLIRHMLAHFAAAEITMRHVLDWAFFVEKHGKEVDWKWLSEALDRYHMSVFFNCINAICVEDLGFDSDLFPVVRCDMALKGRVLRDIISPEFEGEMPSGLFRRVVWKWRRWKANGWKHEICFKESKWSAFWTGVWAKILKPSTI